MGVVGVLLTSSPTNQDIDRSRRNSSRSRRRSRSQEQEQQQQQQEQQQQQQQVRQNDSGFSVIIMKEGVGVWRRII